MRVLIFGAGVIGSIYALHFHRAGAEVAILARGKRLTELLKKGFRYMSNGTVKTVDIKVISEFDQNTYNFIFVTVRYEQIEAALKAIKNNPSKNIVTMVNNPFGYDKWESIVGNERIIPGFAGAGGELIDGVLHYKLTPRLIQPTTFGELSGNQTERVVMLAELMNKSKIPYSICGNMNVWQKCHLAMVIPLAEGIYADGGDNYTTARNTCAVKLIVDLLKEYFSKIKLNKIPITPTKLKMFLLCPKPLLCFVLRKLYNTKFAEAVICKHALNAKNEMLLLKTDFDKMIEQLEEKQ